MIPSACEQAIRIFNETRPEEWPDVFKPEIRHRILAEKSQGLPIEARRLALVSPVKGIVPLYPMRPKFMRGLLARPAAEILTGMFGATVDALEIQEALEDGVSGRRFGVDWIRGQWRIVMPNGDARALWYLQGLSHELGHILAKEPQQSTFADLVRGETFAMMLEALAVSDQLREDERLEWVRYCRQIDESNFRFCRLEAGDLEPLKNDKFIFRESLWTSHGYQAVYAASSLLRQRILGEFYASDKNSRRESVPVPIG